MPTYVITAATGRLSAEQKQAVVDRVTQIHSEEGKAPQYLVQVVFNEVQPGNHFINKRLVPADQVWIRGDIRAGRTEDQKNALARRIMTECGEVIGVDKSYIWTYICDADKTAEYGSILPNPGAEEAWLKQIPKEVRERYGVD